ncbi:MAG: hypothetical protein AAFU49_13670 [Pseudomonadota bacterium]
MDRLSEPLERAMQSERRRQRRPASGERPLKLGAPISPPEARREDRHERAPTSATSPLPWEDEDGFDWDDPAPSNSSTRWVLMAIILALFTGLASQISGGSPWLETQPDAPPPLASGQESVGTEPIQVGNLRSPDMPPDQPNPVGKQDLRLASSDPVMTLSPVGAKLEDPRPVFVVPAAEMLGYAEGRGLSSLAYGLLEGTHCKLNPGAMVVWHRDRPGGAECRVLLFDRGDLVEGWRIERVVLRLGFGTAVRMRNDQLGSTATDAATGQAILTLRQDLLPARFRVLGEVPLPGARFWVAFDRIEISGPAEAKDWHLAFKPRARLD